MGELIATDRWKTEYTAYNITLRKGCAYNTYSREFVMWLLNSDVSRSFIQWANDTDAPGNFFYHNHVQLI